MTMDAEELSGQAGKYMQFSLGNESFALQITEVKKHFLHFFHVRCESGVKSPKK